GGRAGPLLVEEAGEHIPQNGPVTLRHERLNKVLGTNIEAEKVGTILQRLGMRVDEDSGRWTAVAPSSRFDIAIEEDLIEEVARIYGYDNIPEASPTGMLSLVPPPVTRFPWIASLPPCARVATRRRSITVLSIRNC
ncbi:MAG: hypothetical protein R3212_07515, partial [Xanthomonadales bacterium]|nr:hypothetical protein [Xanthomonadales bacterium]